MISRMRRVMSLIMIYMSGKYKKVDFLKYTLFEYRYIADVWKVCITRCKRLSNIQCKKIANKM